MFGMNRYKIPKCFIKEKRNCRRAFLSADRSYVVLSWGSSYLLQFVVTRRGPWVLLKRGPKGLMVWFNGSWLGCHCCLVLLASTANSLDLDQQWGSNIRHHEHSFNYDRNSMIYQVLAQKENRKIWKMKEHRISWVTLDRTSFHRHSKAFIDYLKSA